MLGVMSDTFDEDEASMSGDEDFFSVASTMPFVAGRGACEWIVCLKEHHV